MYQLTLLTGLALSSALSAAQAQDQHQSPVKELRHATQHFGFFLGAWFPTGDLTVLGPHPELGLQWGFRHLQHEFDISLDLRFLKSSNEYAVYRDGGYHYDRSYT